MNFLIQNEQVRKIWEFKGKIDYVDKWFLMGSPIAIPTICLLYLLFVLKWGPAYMKNRPAFKLNGLLILYNIIQVAYSTYMVAEGIKLLRPVNFIFISCAIDEETVRRLTFGIYLYFSAKVSELVDTIFFVLRKKQKQVTFLHVFHHAFMVMAVWLVLKFEPHTYSIIFLGTLNSLVHVFMYAYYGLSAFPSLTKYLWWKRYITWFQLIQFVSVLTHAVGNYIFSECKPSVYLLYTILSSSSLFLYLFLDFYIRTYKKKARSVNEVLKKSTSDVANGNTSEYKNGVPQSNVYTDLNNVRKIR